MTRRVKTALDCFVKRADALGDPLVCEALQVERPGRLTLVGREVVHRLMSPARGLPQPSARLA